MSSATTGYAGQRIPLENVVPMEANEAITAKAVVRRTSANLMEQVDTAGEKAYGVAPEAVADGAVGDVIRRGEVAVIFNEVSGVTPGTPMTAAVETGDPAVPGRVAKATTGDWVLGEAKVVPSSIGEQGIIELDCMTMHKLQA